MNQETKAPWRRLWQPRRGLFWMMLLFNLLSSAGAWLLRWDGLTSSAFGVVLVLSLCNAFVSLWLASRLWRGD